LAKDKDEGLRQKMQNPELTQKEELMSRIEDSIAYNLRGDNIVFGVLDVKINQSYRKQHKHDFPDGIVAEVVESMKERNLLRYKRINMLTDLTVLEPTAKQAFHYESI